MSTVGDRTAASPPRRASVRPVSGGAVRAGRRRRRRSLLPLFLLAPAVVLFGLFTIAPGIYAIWLSFRKAQVGGGLLGDLNPTEVFAGLENYQDAFADPEFWHSIVRMLTVAVIGVPATIVLATTLALCLDAKRARLTGLARLAIFLPYAVPGVVASLLWGFIYLPATSPIGGAGFDYLGSRAVFFSVANVAVWGVLGFNMVVIYTSLRGLPRDLFQAAELDGASELQIALRVKLPMLTPTLTLVTVFSLIGALQLFNEPTTLKPIANAITSTWVPLMRVYTDAFVNNNIYQGAATSFLLIVMTVAATVIANAIIRGISRRSAR